MHAPKPPLCQVAIGAFYEQHLIHEQTTCLPPHRGEVSPQVTERGRKRQRIPLSLADARQLSPCTKRGGRALRSRARDQVVPAVKICCSLHIHGFPFEGKLSPKVTDEVDRPGDALCCSMASVCSTKRATSSASLTLSTFPSEGKACAFCEQHLFSPLRWVSKGRERPPFGRLGEVRGEIEIPPAAFPLGMQNPVSFGGTKEMGF